MQYRLNVARQWRYRDRKRGMTELAPGSYSVPGQVSHDVANLAVEQGMATMHEVQMPRLQPQAYAPLAGVSIPVDVEQPKRKRGRPKKAAPENKALRAPENKQAMV
jgi:hypothetical protein